jgi:hypothetical protein
MWPVLYVPLNCPFLIVFAIYVLEKKYIMNNTICLNTYLKRSYFVKMSYLSMLISYTIYIFHTRVSHIGGWMASVLTTSKVDRGLVTMKVIPLNAIPTCFIVFSLTRPVTKPRSTLLVVSTLAIQPPMWDTLVWKIDKQHKIAQHSKLKRWATRTSLKKTMVNPHTREG